MKTEKSELETLDYFEKVIEAINTDDIRTIYNLIKKSKDFIVEIPEWDDIPKTAPENAESAFMARKLALEISFEHQVDWQHYWYRCCISEKCDYIFSSLIAYNVDREDDLKKICNPKCKLLTEDDSTKTLLKKSQNETKKIYYDNCIDFFLKRYNWTDAIRLCKNFYSYNPNINWIKLVFPRMLSATLLGFLPIMTSGDLRKFAETNQMDLWVYYIFLIPVIYFFLLFECHKTTRNTIIRKRFLFDWDEIPGNDEKKFKSFLINNYGDLKWVKNRKFHKSDDNRKIYITKNDSLSLNLNNDETKASKVKLKINNVKKDEFSVITKNKKLNIYQKKSFWNKSCWIRSLLIFSWSILFFSLLISFILTINGLLGNENWCWWRGTFYALLAGFIGILLQLLWEEKTVTEPL